MPLFTWHLQAWANPSGVSLNRISFLHEDPRFGRLFPPLLRSAKDFGDSLNAFMGPTMPTTQVILAEQDATKNFIGGLPEVVLFREN